MNELTKTILSDGFAAVSRLVEDSEEETLQLEFKTLSDASGRVLNRADRQLIAKSVCGLANAAGGVLVLGIQTTRQDDIDVAVGVQLFADAHALRSRVATALAEALDPQHPGITVHPISQDDRPSGIVVIDVPQSDRRPHMSVAAQEGRYYRRGVDRTRLMTNAEVRELMFAPRNAEIDVDFCAGGYMRQGTFFRLNLELVVRNSGLASAIAPYARVNSRLLLLREELRAHFVQNDSRDGTRTLASLRSFVLHPGEEVVIGRIQAGVQFTWSTYSDADSLVSRSIETGNLDSFFFPDGYVDPLRGQHPGRGAPPKIKGFVGAENALRKDFEFEPTDLEFLSLAQPAIAAYGR